MLSKTLFGILGVVLLVAFVAPVFFKIREIALGLVILLGVLPALVDTIQSIRGTGE
jgi:hypothetical protein